VGSTTGSGWSLADTGKIFVTILCGAGDWPIDRLGGRTPLEFASVPTLDALARRGALCHLTVIDDRITPESDSGAMALLGYDPLVYYTGRGALEGLGLGFLDEANPGVAFRVNFASRDQASGRLDRRTARDLSDAEQQQLASEVRQGVSLRGAEYDLTAFGRHRGILCLRSDSLVLSGNVTNTDPGFERIGAFGVPTEKHGGAPDRCLPLEQTEAAANTARLVDEFTQQSAQVLEASAVNRDRRSSGRLPANLILFRDGGHELPRLAGFREQTGLTVALYGQVPAEHGLCKLIGGRFVESKPPPDRVGDYYRRLAHDVSVDQADVVLVHLKGGDEPGHDNRPREKAAALELIDRHYVHELVSRAGPGDTIVFTGDHATPCEYGIHSLDPVPTLAVGPGIPSDDRVRFDEREAAAGGLPVDRAVELLSFVAGVRAAP
jgi:2,3-bisphosphoglycerate-independent phosphoglycerate mutase